MGISGSLGAAVTGFMMFGGSCRVLEGAVVRGERKGRGGEEGRVWGRVFMMRVGRRMSRVG